MTPHGLRSYSAQAPQVACRHVRAAQAWRRGQEGRGCARRAEARRVRVNAMRRSRSDCVPHALRCCQRLVLSCHGTDAPRLRADVGGMVMAAPGRSGALWCGVCRRAAHGLLACSQSCLVVGASRCHGSARASRAGAVARAGWSWERARGAARRVRSLVVRGSRSDGACAGGQRVVVRTPHRPSGALTRRVLTSVWAGWSWERARGAAHRVRSLVVRHSRSDGACAGGQRVAVRAPQRRSGALTRRVLT